MVVVLLVICFYGIEEGDGCGKGDNGVKFG